MTAATDKSGARWIKRFGGGPQVSLRLFCFPYAGGGAGVFSGWSKRLPRRVEVCAIELPGRSTRLSEPPWRRLPELADAIAAVLRGSLDLPYAIFGHSLGGVLGFEVTRRLTALAAPPPIHLFVSGCRGPQAMDRETTKFDLPADEFLAELRRLDGTPAEALSNAELMRTMVPILRADFEMLDTYVYERMAPLRLPLTVFGGLDDPEVSAAQLDAWRLETTGRIDVRMLPGGHLFINSATDLLLFSLAADLDGARTVPIA
ncbi:MAG: thioesterase II family protein [Vicinamibacterales bacterium]